MDAWRSDRRLRISRPETIDIAQESIEVINTGSTEATVRLQFTYSTPTYADRTVKELVLATENGNWAIREENNISVAALATVSPQGSQAAVMPITRAAGESGFEAKIRQVLNLVGTPSAQELSTPFGMFLNDWLGAWKNQDVERYFGHYHNEFRPVQFDSLGDWRADRIRKINNKRFIEIAFDDIEVLDENDGNTRVRFWLSYVSSFYLDRTLKEVVIASGNNAGGLGIIRERNIEVEIIPFYP